jgi:lipoprotein-anchoring transpeptidase ErfK/SrfK
MVCSNCQKPIACVNGSWLCLNCQQNTSLYSENSVVKKFYSKKIFQLGTLAFSGILLFFCTTIEFNSSNHKVLNPIISISSVSTRYSDSNTSIAELSSDVSQSIPINKAVDIPIESTLNNKRIVVSQSQQELWAFNGNSEVYSSAVITGAIELGQNTPLGTWKIYAKSTNVYLKGPTWNDFVQYWMPFYGSYGLHDASWRDSTQFGTQSYTSNGSHGCVELPTSTAAWLYNWAQIGTSVTIEN